MQSTSPHNLRVGDHVFIHTNDRPVPGAQRHAKLDLKKVGPFPIKQVLSRHRFKLDLPPDLYSDNLFNTSQLEPTPKKHGPFNHSLDAPVTIDSRGDTHFEVEAIVGQQTFRNYVQYCVKWCGDPCTTWEFEEDLLEDGCEAAIRDWNSRNTSSSAAITHMLNPSLCECPIAFISTATSPADAKLLGLELEISCLAWAFHCLQHFLEGASKITVITDHAPLGAVLRGNSPSLRQFTPHIKQFRAYLMPFLNSMEFTHKPGKHHSNVDALSRLPAEHSLPGNHPS